MPSNHQSHHRRPRTRRRRRNRRAEEQHPQIAFGNMRQRRNRHRRILRRHQTQNCRMRSARRLAARVEKIRLFHQSRCGVHAGWNQQQKIAKRRCTLMISIRRLQIVTQGIHARIDNLIPIVVRAALETNRADQRSHGKLWKRDSDSSIQRRAGRNVSSQPKMAEAAIRTDNVQRIRIQRLTHRLAQLLRRRRVRRLHLICGRSGSLQSKRSANCARAPSSREKRKRPNQNKSRDRPPTNYDLPKHIPHLISFRFLTPRLISFRLPEPT